jgi:hypothetical protein
LNFSLENSHERRDKQVFQSLCGARILIKFQQFSPAPDSGFHFIRPFSGEYNPMYRSLFDGIGSALLHRGVEQFVR